MKYYIVGIKGSGLSGLAQILLDLGNSVKGADVDQEIFTQYNLQKNNIQIESLNDMHYEDCDIIIVGNAFLDKFDFNGKKTISYQDMISKLNDMYYSIAVCGTHGKTTTTNMIKHVLGQLEPITYLVGDGQGHGEKNARFFVYEACEHRDHFLNYHPNMTICTNVDYDHVEYFSNQKQYRRSFKKFFRQTSDIIIINDSISFKNEKECCTYGLNNASVKAYNVKYNDKGIYFDLLIHNNVYNNLFLPFYGKHMLLNSLACISCLVNLDYDVNTIVSLLKTYKSAGRRYNITFVKNNIIVDDYGHHPKEIQSTVNAIKQEFNDKKLIIIYHPDRPKRLTFFLNKYKKVFSSCEKTYVLPFINQNEEEINALNLLIDKQKIVMFSEEIFKNNYNNFIFLFTGSKEMKPIILKLIGHLS